MEDTNKMEMTDVVQKLETILEKNPLEQEEVIQEIIQKSNLTKTVIRQQLASMIKAMHKEYQEGKNVTQGEAVAEGLERQLNIAFNKKSLAEHIIELQPCYYDTSKIWWLWDWNQCKWKKVDEVDIINAVEKQADINTINSKERTEMLEALKQVSRVNRPQDIKPTWIQFKKDIIDIETGKRFRAKPNWFVTNPIPYELDENGFFETPVMDRIFEEWVGKDYIPILYEIIAYCTMPDMPIHRIFCFIGEGMNGKSKFLELLRKFIGQENCCSTELDALMTSRFEIARLHKKLVCQMGETDFNEMKKTSILKSLSGGDLMGFEIKNKDPFEDKNYAKILIATNNLPSTADKTAGFYRRWAIIDFPNQFSEAKDILAEIPEEEYQALAVKCSFLLRDLLKARKFTKEGTLEERMEKYEAKSNFLEKFINEFTEESINDYITVSDFNRKFKEWCKEHRHREMAERSIAQSLKKLRWEAIKKHFGWMHDGRGGQARCWADVRWKV